MKYDIAFKNWKFLFLGIIAAIFILFIGIMAMIWVIGLSPDAPIFMNITGHKLELIKLIGWGVSGLIAILSVIGLFQRGSALDRQNEISEQNYIQRADEIKEIQIQERFKAAAEHLSNERVSARIASFYEFYRLAKIESEPDLKENIFDILCAHLRQITKDENYQSKERESDQTAYEISKPIEEVQSLLNTLFKIRNKNDLIFRGMNADLAATNLQGANLQEANLQYAILHNTNLENAILQEANLQEANLQEAKLQYAKLQKANMQNANLQGADLLGANLSDANMQQADMCQAYLHYANLQRTNLQDVDMEDVNLKNANLQGANLQGANLFNAMINKETTMPDNWGNMVKKYEDGETGVRFVK